MTGSNFLPQGISFKAQAQTSPAAFSVDFGPEHTALSETLKQQPEASEQLSEQLILLESRWRIDWLKVRLTNVRTALRALIEAAEDPAQWRSETCQSCQKTLIGALDELRTALQKDYLALLPPQRQSLTPIQRFITAQLTKLDALGLLNASAWEKSREQAQSFKSQLIQAEILPEELFTLAELDRLLDTAVRYQFAWEAARNAKGKLEEHLTTLQKIAVTGLKSPRAPEPQAVPGTVWSWRNQALRNDLGVPVHSLRRSYPEWLQLGLRCLKLARKQTFTNNKPLYEALECFYAAHSLARDRAEPLVALGAVLTLLNQPAKAVDCLELALKREALPEIKALFWQLQALEEAIGE